MIVIGNFCQYFALSCPEIAIANRLIIQCYFGRVCRSEFWRGWCLGAQLLISDQRSARMFTIVVADGANGQKESKRNDGL